MMRSPTRATFRCPFRNDLFDTRPDLDYSPILDESGKSAGKLGAVVFSATVMEGHPGISMRQKLVGLSAGIAQMNSAKDTVTDLGLVLSTMRGRSVFRWEFSSADQKNPDCSRDRVVHD